MQQVFVVWDSGRPNPYRQVNEVLRSGAEVVSVSAAPGIELSVGAPPDGPVKGSSVPNVVVVFVLEGTPEQLGVDQPSSP